jgi:flavorubredoxin
LATIHEIAPDVFRVTVWEKDLNIQFNHFLVRDDEPLLFHTGYNRAFPELREAVAKILDPAKIRWIGFSHFESDECGSLNRWLELAPHARPLCTFLSAILSVNDFAIREARVVPEGESLATGRYRFQVHSTGHLPHGWDAGVLFEETQRTLFCSDLLFQFGESDPVTAADILEPVRRSLMDMEKSVFAYSVPFTPQTEKILARLAGLRPKTLATMHGASYNGDCAAALRDYGVVLREILGPE